MKASQTRPWELLFPPPTEGASATTRTFRLVLKRGEPLLLVPDSPRVARHALALYPSQTPTARIARRLQAAALRFGLPLGTNAAHIYVDPQSPFVRFLGAPAAGPQPANFAMLLGNPRAPGRRFVLLVFDPSDRPARIVKAGVGQAATALIRREAAFLKSADRHLLHAPAITGEFAWRETEAFALEYAAGPTPQVRDVAPLACLLESWLALQVTMRFADLAITQRLVACAPADPRVRCVLAKLDAVRFHPPVFHGDFAPWNIRLRPHERRWVVLDWEHAEPTGPPAWDWFHFFIQNEILVRRARAEDLVRRLNELVHSPHFAHYAALAGIADCVRPLLLGYLLYCCHLQRQAEGMPQLEELLEALSAA